MPAPRAFQWTQELSDYASELAAVECSRRLSVDGAHFAVPTREDYERTFRAAGALRAGEEWADRPELVAAVQAHWHASGHDPCVFAQHMSARRDDHGWDTFVLDDHGSAAADADALDAVCAPRLVAPEAEVVSVVLPHGDGSQYLGGVLARLDALEGWRVTDQGTEEDPSLGRLVRLGLRVTVEFGFRSEVLGFGPYAGLASSRQAPFTELAVRAKPPRRRRGNKRAFMADVAIFPPLEPSQFRAWRRRTKAERARRLGAGHDARGKARVVFALPEQDWRRETT